MRRREAVVLVVKGDLVEQPLVARLEPVLVGNDAAGGVDDLGRSLAAVERLEFLQRIRLGPDPNGLPDYPIQVDEHPAAQELVDLSLPGRIGTRQILERVRLVWRVVIDVHIRIAIEPLDQEVDDLLEGTLLFIRIVAPEGVMDRLPALPLEGDGVFENAKEVLEAVVADEGISLHVEEEVVQRWRWERLEAQVLAERRQDLKRKRVAMPLLHLETSLLSEPGDSHLVDAVDRLVDRTGAELGNRLDSREVQAPGLISTHAGDQAEMVVLPTAELAHVDPAADAAVVDRIWIGGRGWPKHGLLELTLDAPVVGPVVLQAQLLLTAIAED